MPRKLFLATAIIVPLAVAADAIEAPVNSNGPPVEHGTTEHPVAREGIDKGFTTLQSYLERERNRDTADRPSTAFALAPVKDRVTPAPDPGTATITDGMDAQPGMLEDSVRIELHYMEKDTDRFASGECSGVLIHERIIMTAAHCLVPEWMVFDLTSAFVFYGSHEREDPASSAVVEPRQTVVHQDYNRFAPRSGHDIGLIFLSNPLTGAGIKPATLAGPKALSQTESFFFIAGWGKTLSHSTDGALVSAGRLLYAEIPLIGDDGNSVASTDTATRETLLAQPVLQAGRDSGDIPIGACVGDSGGGFYIADGIQITPGTGITPYIVGITSFGRTGSETDAASGDDFCLQDKTRTFFTNALHEQDEILRIASAFSIDPSEIQFSD